jgi:hypothetical protein
MNQDRDQLVKEIFADALERTDAAQCAAYLAQACGDDVPMRQQVEALLKAHAQAGGFLEKPGAVSPGETVTLSTALTEKPGDRIGRYKLLQQIGEGGYGVVYMAEQQEPIRRRVALTSLSASTSPERFTCRPWPNPLTAPERRWPASHFLKPSPCCKVSPTKPGNYTTQKSCSRGSPPRRKSSPLPTALLNQLWKSNAEVLTVNLNHEQRIKEIFADALEKQPPPNHISSSLRSPYEKSNTCCCRRHHGGHGS